MAPVITLIDITERRQRERAGVEHEQRLHSIIEGASEYAIFMIDTVGRIASWNAGARRIFGYEETEIVGRPFAMLMLNGQSADPFMRAEMSSALQQDVQFVDGWRKRRDGSQFWASGVLTALRDASGTIKGYAKILRDATDRKRIEEQLVESRVQAEHESRRKDEVIATVSHELRTPVQIILSWMPSLKRGVPEEMGRQALSMIERAAEAQRHIIEDLLDASRMGKGRMQLAIASVALEQVVLDAVEAVKREVMNNQQELRVELDPQLGTVMADAARLQQLLWNLLTNAIKFTPPGGRVVVAAKRDGDAVTLAVRDTGVGIHHGRLANMFQPFQVSTNLANRHYGGLGLGLAICKHIAELHGGNICVDSEGENRGTSVTVRLVLAPL